MARVYLGVNVLQATQERIAYTFDNFQRIYVSFSGGKDSTVMLHLVMEECKKRNRKVGLLFIDWEIQYKLTIEFVAKMFNEYKDYIIPYWVCIPITTESVISQYSPTWTCWDDSKEDLWIRDKPEIAIKDKSYFNFYTENITFEEFIVKFGEWYATKDILDTNTLGYEAIACFVGIRTVESFNRLLKITVSKNRNYFNGKRYLLNSKSSSMNICLCHPIYDWKTEDIWRFFGKFYKPYNQIYDLLHKAGLSISQQRIDEFFGSAARRSLSMLQVLEPDTWGKVTGRIIGCNSGALYSKDRKMTGNGKIKKPNGHTWQSFTKFLLDTMPRKTSEHYQNKIAIYLKWYLDRDYPEGLPDEQEQDLEAKDNHPSWRRICKVILRGDYWCKALSFTPTKATHYERYLKVVKKRRVSWNMFN
jgi:predicted phosphoadenosine phosphosulfate sulfurtransferase